MPSNYWRWWIPWGRGLSNQGTGAGGRGEGGRKEHLDAFGNGFSGGRATPVPADSVSPGSSLQNGNIASAQRPKDQGHECVLSLVTGFDSSVSFSSHVDALDLRFQSESERVGGSISPSASEAEKSKSFCCKNRPNLASTGSVWKIGTGKEPMVGTTKSKRK